MPINPPLFPAHLFTSFMLIHSFCWNATLSGQTQGKEKGFSLVILSFPCTPLCRFRFFLIPLSLHPTTRFAHFPPFLLSLLDFCFSHSEIPYRKPELDSANSERSILEALQGLSMEGNFLSSGNDSRGYYHTSFISAVWGQNSFMAVFHNVHLTVNADYRNFKECKFYKGGTMVCVWVLFSYP